MYRVEHVYRSATERSPNRVQPPPSNLQHKKYFTKEKTRKDELPPCQIIDWLQLQPNYAEIGILCDILLKKPWIYIHNRCVTDVMKHYLLATNRTRHSVTMFCLENFGLGVTHSSEHACPASNILTKENNACV